MPGSCCATITNTEHSLTCARWSTAAGGAPRLPPRLHQARQLQRGGGPLRVPLWPAGRGVRAAGVPGLPACQHDSGGGGGGWGRPADQLRRKHAPQLRVLQVRGRGSSLLALQSSSCACNWWVAAAASTPPCHLHPAGSAGGTTAPRTTPAGYSGTQSSGATITTACRRSSRWAPGPCSSMPSTRQPGSRRAPALCGPPRFAASAPSACCSRAGVGVPAPRLDQRHLQSGHLGDVRPGQRHPLPGL